MSVGTYKIVRPNSLVLPRSGRFHRNPPRPVELRQKNYDEKFDFDTVFTDVFKGTQDDGEDVIFLNGPPLLNLRDPFLAGTYVGADTGLVGTRELRDVRSSQKSRVHGLGASRTLRISLENGLVRDVDIAANDRHLFRGRKCLVAISKDNELTWIRDWAQFYSRVHGVDAVLLYDNGSTRYDSADVLEALSSVEGISVAVVVEWPYPFGPQGGNWDGLQNVRWDSTYCQAACLENARWRFLNEAEGVLHCDIDELMVSDSGTIFDELAASDGLVYFQGHWIENLRKPGAEGVPAFQDYEWMDLRRQPTTRKWLVDPRRCGNAGGWRTHHVIGVEGVQSTTTAHRHFLGISTSWKFDRETPVTFDPEFHVKDDLLGATLKRAFGAEPRSTLADRRPLTSRTIRGRVRDAAPKLSPRPTSVAFSPDGILDIDFDRGVGSFTLHVRFKSVTVCSSVTTESAPQAQALEGLYGGEGPWELGTETMRQRTKATVAKLVIRGLQRAVDEIVQNSPEEEKPPVPPAPRPRLSRRVWRAVRRRAGALRRRLR